MKTANRMVAMVFTLLLVSVQCTFFDSTPLTIESRNLQGYSEFRRWNDKNGNKVDDLIDGAALGPFDIFVDYAVHPNSSHINELNQTIGTGSISSVYQYIDTIAAQNVPEALIPLIGNLPDVTMVWKQPEVKSFLDVSTRAIKARYSTTYNDEYVWSGSGEAGDNITKGENITIAILDTGVDDEHEALAGKFLAGFDATKFEDRNGDGDDDLPPYEPADGSTNPDDLDLTFSVFHGTHCAGTALGNPPDGVYMGVAPEAMLVDIRVLTALGTGSMSDVIEGIEWAQTHKDTDWGVPGYEGIDVLSVSLGSSNASDGSDPCSTAINNAVEAGIVVVVAAGNDGPDNDGLGAPAAADFAITVAAVNDSGTVDRGDDTIAWFSSRGPRDDDGDDDPYDELKPEVAAYGEKINASKGSNVPGGASNKYHELRGTSMATPHVAGVAALILSHYESIGTSLTPTQVDEILRYTAEDRDGTYNPILSNKYDVDYGWGIVDAYWAAYPHDIAIIDVAPYQTWVCSGDSLQIEVTVENQGGFPGMDRATTQEIFNVSIYYGSNLIEKKSNIFLLPENQVTISFNWDTSDDPLGEYTITARASEVPLEFETGDNSLADGTVLVLRPLKIGIIGPQASPHWSPGIKEAAQMATNEINSAGGIDIGGRYYGVKLVYAHEHAMTGPGGTPEPSEAYDEMVRLCDPALENCTVVIGGFRTECVVKLIQAAVEYETPFFINGASTSELVNATTQPYVWRINPINSTMIFKTIAGALASYLIPYKLQPLFGCDLDGNATTPNQVRVAVLAEDLAWTNEMYYYLTNPGVYPLVLGPYANVTYAARIPDGTTDCTTWLDAVNASKARLLIHIFSGMTGIPLMAQFGARQIRAMPVGINVMGQLEQHWANTGGECDYESILNFAGTATPIIPGLTDVFWDNFVGNFSAWPLYTAWGAYDGVYAMAEAFEAIGTTGKFQLKNHLENPSYQRQALNGIFKYTSNHDVHSNEYGPTWIQDYIRAFVVQWRVQWSGTTPIGGRMEVVCPVDKVYSKKWAIPPEMYPLVEDITYDGKVDMRDVGMAARAFGSYPGHPRWEKEADINFDNKVDMKDIGGIARKFGVTHPLPALPC